MLVQSLTKTKDSPAKRRIVDGPVVEVAESAVILITALTESPALAAVEDAAP